MELQPCHHTYQSLFYAMKSGFVYGQILTDSNEKPVNIRILEINPAFETMTSLYAKDIVGKTLLEFDPNMMSDSFPWIQIYGQAALMGESVEVEKYSSRFQSWFRIQAFSPKPGYFAAFVEDITQRKKIEIENTSNERRLQALIRVLQSPFDDIQSFLDNALNEAIHITGSKYGYIYLYHEESQELTLNTWSSGVLNDCNIPNTNIVYTLKDTGFWGDVVRYQKTILDNQFQKSSPRKKGTPEGHVQIKKYLSIPVFFNNRIVAVVGVANKREDYTTTDELQLKLLMDSVWSIVENQQSGKEVEYQKTIQHNLAASLANSPLGMMYWKYSHGVATVLEWNPTAEEIFGWSANDIVGYSFTDKLYYPDDIEKAHLRIQELQKTKKSYHFQNRCYTKNNQILTIRWFVSYIKEESEGILYGMSLAENLTEIETAKQNVELIKKQFEYAL
ncbi:MAG: GAF domain-containing protein, partial [Caldisericia bacterium]|nr:GAF domain-containing protein [Caldisericia bacterium]